MQDVKYNLSHTCYIYILFIHSVTFLYLLYQMFRILHYKNLLLIYIYPFLVFPLYYKSRKQEYHTRPGKYTAHPEI